MKCSACHKEIEWYVWDLCKECFNKEFEQVFDYGCVQCGRSIGDEGERVELRTSNNTKEVWICSRCLAWTQDKSDEVERMRNANDRRGEL